MQYHAGGALNAFLGRADWWCFDYLLTLASLLFSQQGIARGRRDDMPRADGSSTVAEIAADLRPSANGSEVRTSLVAGGG